MSYAMYAQLGQQVVGGYMAIKAAKSQAKAARFASIQEFEELQRQQKETSRIAAKEASDRYRAANRTMGAMLAAMSDNGAEGTTNESRFAGEIGYISGTDIENIYANANSQVAALRSQQYASQIRALNVITGAFNQAQATIWNGAGKTASSAASSYGGGGATKQTQTGSTGSTQQAGTGSGYTYANANYAW